MGVALSVRPLSFLYNKEELEKRTYFYLAIESSGTTESGIDCVWTVRCRYDQDTCVRLVDTVHFGKQRSDDALFDFSPSIVHTARTYRVDLI